MQAHSALGDPLASRLRATSAAAAAPNSSTIGGAGTGVGVPLDPELPLLPDEALDAEEAEEVLPLAELEVEPEALVLKPTLDEPKDDEPLLLALEALLALDALDVELDTSPDEADETLPDDDEPPVDEVLLTVPDEDVLETSPEEVELDEPPVEEVLLTEPDDVDEVDEISPDEVDEPPLAEETLPLDPPLADETLPLDVDEMLITMPLDPLLVVPLEVPLDVPLELLVDDDTLPLDETLPLDALPPDPPVEEITTLPPPLPPPKKPPAKKPPKPPPKPPDPPMMTGPLEPPPPIG